MPWSSVNMRAAFRVQSTLESSVGRQRHYPRCTPPEWIIKKRAVAVMLRAMRSRTRHPRRQTTHVSKYENNANGCTALQGFMECTRLPCNQGPSSGGSSGHACRGGFAGCRTMRACATYGE